MSVLAEFNLLRFRSLLQHMRLTRLFLLLAIALLAAETINAQMFSVRTEREQITIPRTAISGGVSLTDFAYRGPSDQQIEGTNQDYSFSAPLAYMHIDLQGFTLYGVYGRGLGDFSNVYSELGAEISNGVLLTGSPVFSVLVPITLGTNYVLVRNQSLQSTADEFRQNSLGIKSGLQMNARLSRASRFQVDAQAGYAFSVTGYGLSGGSAADWNLSNRLFFDRIFGDVGIVVGLDIRSRRYRLDESIFNYRTTQQQLTLGLTF